jgi:hypothetical protein
MIQDKFSAIAETFHASQRWSSAECAEIFGRLITDSLLDGELTERLAERWGTHAGHYGRLALAEQERAIEAARAVAYVKSGLDLVMSAAFGGRR